MAISVDSCVVALLGRANGAREQLRRALEDLGAQVAFEGDLGSASQQVLDAAPTVVIVNLEEGADEALEHLQAVFDSDTINVVFNDAEVSARLEGWDLARWARHLAAKVLGHDDTLPPLPEGALLLPEYQAPALQVQENAAEAQDGPDSDSRTAAFEIEAPEAETPTMLEAVAASESFENFTAEDDDGSLPEWALAEDDPVEAAENPAQDLAFDSETAPAAADESGSEAAARFDWDMDDFSAPAQPEEAAASTDWPSEQGEAFEAEADAEGWNPSAYSGSEDNAENSAGAQDVFDMDAFDSAGLAAADEGEAEAVAEAQQSDEFEFDWQMDADALAQIPSGGDLATSTPATGAEPASPEALALDQDIAALLSQFDASLDAGDDAASEAAADVPQGLDFSNLERPTEKPASAPPAPRQFERSAEELDRLMNAASGLSLTAMEEEGEGDEAAAAAPAASKTAESSFDFSILGDLSLEPMSDPDSEDSAPNTGPADFGAAAPVLPSDDLAPPQDDPLLAAMGLTEAADDSDLSLIPTAGSGGGEIPRVVVLAASIGGPDALRTFLGGLSPDVQAAFLIVQHLESGYFDRLAQQLQKSSALPVKVATRGMRIGVGEVAVVPASERVTLEADGQFSFSTHDSPPQYSPSIDGVLRDVADRFGRRSTAIIFSGMAGDGIEGAAYLTSRGGEVWVQSPSSCVVSSMVDAAITRGIVEFTGSPRELAGRCTAMLAG